MAAGNPGTVRDLPFRRLAGGVGGTRLQSPNGLGGERDEAQGGHGSGFLSTAFRHL